MKRTPPWVWVAAAVVQIAALCLCTWAMETWVRSEDDERDETPSAPAPRTREPAEPPAPASQQPAPAATPSPSVAAAHGPNGAAPAQRTEPAAEPERELPAAREAWRQPEAIVPPARPPEPPAVPMFGPPPVRENDPDAVPAFISEVADGTTQLMRGYSRARPVIFGFYPDGNIRFVDVDGGRYAGRAESARARMREVDGTRAFTVQIAVDGQQQLQAIFTGGVHDSETLPLEPLVGWSVA